MTKALLQSNQLPITILNTFRMRWAELVTSISLYQKRRARWAETYSELARLSNRELDDIGIPRSDIAKIAQEEAMKADIK